MNGLLVLYCALARLSLAGSATNNTEHPVSAYEYGARLRGDQLALVEKNFIPRFVPQHVHNVTHARASLQQRYSYLRVQYLSAVSPVRVRYEPDVRAVRFNVPFPFADIPYGILGYAAPRSAASTRTISTKYV